MKRGPVLPIAQPEKAVEMAAADMVEAARLLRAELLPLEQAALNAEAMQQAVTLAKVGMLALSQAMVRMQKAQADVETVRRRMEGGWWR